MKPPASAEQTAEERFRSLFSREPSAVELSRYRRRRADLVLRLPYGARRRAARVIAHV